MIRAVGMLAAFESEGGGKGGRRKVTLGGKPVKNLWDWAWPSDPPVQKEGKLEAVGRSSRCEEKLEEGEEDGPGVGHCHFFFWAIRSFIADLSSRSPLAGPVGREVGRTGAGVGKGHLWLIKSASFWFSLPDALPSWLPSFILGAGVGERRRSSRILLFMYVYLKIYVFLESWFFFSTFISPTCPF